METGAPVSIRASIGTPSTCSIAFGTGPIVGALGALGASEGEVNRLCRVAIT